MADRKPSPVDNARKSKRRKQDDGDLQKPKRPLSAYNLFFRDERSQYLEDRAAKKIQDVSEKSPFLAMSAEISKRWMNLPFEQRQKYNSMAEEETIKYHLKVDAYKAKQRVLDQPAELEPRHVEPGSHTRTARSFPYGAEDQGSLSQFLSTQEQAARPFSYRSNDQTSLAQSSMISRSQQQQQRMPSGVPYASMSSEGSMLLHQLLQQQLESSSTLQGSLQHRLPSNSQGQASLELDALRRDAQRETIAPQDHAALLRSVLEHQENDRQQQQLAGLADLVDRELNRRILMFSHLGSPTQNQYLQRQARATSFLPANATDISTALSSRAGDPSRGDQVSSQIAQRGGFHGSLFGGESKEASPMRNQVGSAAGLPTTSRDDILLRMLLASQPQHTSILSSNTPMLPGGQAALALQQRALSQSSPLIDALTQGRGVPNADEQQDPSSRSPK